MTHSLRYEVNRNFITSQEQLIEEKEEDIALEIPSSIPILNHYHLVPSSHLPVTENR